MTGASTTTSAADSNSCSIDDCYAPETTCHMGNAYAKCPHWTGRSTDPGELLANQPSVLEGHTVLPWSGSALGLTDLSFVSGRAKPIVVGILGGQNAGKTTLLGAWYLLNSRGITGSAETQSLEGHRSRQFAGSYTFAGWEAVSSSMRWAPGQRPSFPPHTTSRAGRAPGLLHLEFREDKRQLRSYLFADAPGEWFQKWAINKDAVDAEGARWVAEHADVFLLVADTEALGGPNAGAARSALQRLAVRLAAERSYGGGEAAGGNTVGARRPVALVFTKHDAEISPALAKAAREVVARSIPDAVEFNVSIKAVQTSMEGNAGSIDRGQGLAELLDWTLNARRQSVTLAPVAATSADPLFLFGTRATGTASA